MVHSFRRKGCSSVIALGCMSCSPAQDTVGIVHTPGENPATCAAGVPLLQRAEGRAVALVVGAFDPPTGDNWPLLRRDQYVTLQGQGYLCLRWQIEYSLKAGLIRVPTFTALEGLFLHVGGGGGKNLGDPQPGTSGTWLGNAEEGLSYMPEGVAPPWQNEFYYLDGQVTITQNESEGLYNVTVSPQTYDQLLSPTWGLYDPGVICDPK